MSKSAEEYNETQYIQFPGTKKEAWRVFEPRAVVVDQSSYYQTVPVDFPLAWCRCRYSHRKSGIYYAEPLIFVNRDDFIVRGVDYRGLIRTFIRHESTEIFRMGLLDHQAYKKDGAMQTGEIMEESHRMSLEEQYRLAWNEGIQVRLLDFMIISANRLFSGLRRNLLIEENKKTFDKIAKER